MKIAFLTPEYPHSKVKHAAGIGTSIKNLVQGLVKKDVNVTVFIYAQKLNEVFEEEGITFHLISDKNYSFGKWFLYPKHIQNYCNGIIKSEKIDVIEAPDWTGITAFIKFSAPLVIRFHGSDTYFCHIEKRKQKWKNRLLETLAVRKAQGYLAPTKFAGELSAELFGLKKDKVETIHYGISLNQFKNDNASEFEKGVILYIGTLIRKKGVFELPEIFKKVIEQVPDAQLILIGGDSADIKTGNSSTWKLLQQEFSEKLLKNVTYLGQIPYSDVKSHIKRSNVCIFPTYAETLGMVTIESMAMQKPVVNSSIGWAQELMEDSKSGFLVHPSNHDLYSERIVSLINDNSLYTKIGNEALSFVSDHFDIDNIVIQNINFYKKIIQHS